MNNKPMTWEELQASGIDPFTASDDEVARLELAYAELRRRNLEGVGNGIEGVGMAGSAGSQGSGSEDRPNPDVTVL